MTLTIALLSVAGLLALAVLAIAVVHAASGRAIVYGGALAICTIAGLAALRSCSAPPRPRRRRCRFGLPWLGAHFRLDALSAFFLVVVNLGGALASLFALGYGRHEQTPRAGAAVLSGVPRRHEPRRAGRRRLHLPGLLGVHVARPPGRW